MHKAEEIGKRRYVERTVSVCEGGRGAEAEWGGGIDSTSSSFCE